MDLYHKLLIGFAVLLLAGGVLGAFEYVSVREEKARIEERQKADVAIMQAKDAALKVQGDQLAQATANFEKFKQDQAIAMNSLEQRFAAAETAQQNAKLAEQLLGLAAGSVKVGGTAANPTIETPIAQAKAYAKECEECKLNLTSATKSLDLAAQRQAFLESQAAELKDKLNTVTKERDDAKKFTAGGTFKQRLGHDAKVGVLWGAAEAILLALTGHLH